MMQHLNIHWKGYPHHNLPRIRVASSHPDDIHSRFLSKIASYDVIGLPFELALEKSREQQRKEAKRRIRCPRRLSGDAAVNRQISRGLEQDKGTFRGNSWRGNFVERHETGDENSFPVNRNSRTPCGNERLADYPSSLVVPPKEGKENCSLLTYETQAPVHQTRPTTAPRITAAKGGHQVSLLEIDHVHVVPDGRTYNRLPTNNEYCTYNPRLPGRTTLRRTKSTFPSCEPSRQSPHTNIASRKGIKAIELDWRSSPLGKLTNQGTSPRSPSMEPAIPIDTVAQVYSRTPSEQRALDKFTRELELHIVASPARNASLTTTTSSASCSSVHTIIEFIPYLAEFQAAGLAVTSNEQRNTSSRHLKTLLASPSQPNDIPGSSHKYKVSEGNDSPTKSRCNVCAYSSSSDMTIIEFTAIEDLPNSSTIEEPPPQRTTSKKVLPWLRKGSQIQKEGISSQSSNGVAQSLEATIESSREIKDSHSPSSRPSTTKMSKKATRPSPNTKDIRETSLSSPISPESLKINKLIIARPITIINEEFEAMIPVSERVSSKRTFQKAKISGKLSTAVTRELSKSDRRATLRDTGNTPDTRAPVVGFQSSSKRQKLSTEDTLSIATNKKTSKSIVSTERSINPLAQEILPSQFHQHCASPESYSVLSMEESRQNSISPKAQNLHHHSHKPKSTSKPGEVSLSDAYISNISSASEQALGKAIKDYEFPDRSFNPANKAAEISTRTLPRAIGNPAKRRSTTKLGPSPQKCCQCDSATISGSKCCDSMEESTVTTALSVSEVSDRDVFKGLQVAIAAACDKDVDAWIKEMSGHSVRRFLADLRAFKALGVDALADVALKTAQKKRREYKRARNAHGMDVRKGAKAENKAYTYALGNVRLPEKQKRTM